MNAEELIKAYEQTKSAETLNELIQKFWLPTLNFMMKMFQSNVEFLSKYPYLSERNFVPPTKNRYLIFLVDDNFAFKFDQETKTFERLEINSVRETKYFFEDLSKPISIANEFNKFNLQFLSDVVRDSRDFAGDNHIYVTYDSVSEFSLLMYYVDMSKICRDEKFVFLINGGG